MKLEKVKQDIIDALEHKAYVWERMPKINNSKSETELFKKRQEISKDLRQIVTLINDGLIQITKSYD